MVPADIPIPIRGRIIQIPIEGPGIQRIIPTAPDMGD
jgi:hypothetical protein